jgi:hypothetical protein
MRTNLLKKGVVLGILLLFIGISTVPSSGSHFTTTPQETKTSINQTVSTGVTEVWVDDDYYNGGDNDGHLWGYDAFDTIQDGIDHVENFGIIHVKEGIYDIFVIEDRFSLQLIGEDEPIVTGYQLVYDTTYSAYAYNVIFVNNSYNIHLDGFHIVGTNPTPTDRDFTIFYQNSNGEIQNCTIDANSIGNMNGIAMRAIIESSVTLSHCLLKDYGRVAVYAKTATILSVLNCTLIGQVYTQYNWVSYGIEIEGIDNPCLGILKGNDISNHDNTQTAAWSSAGIIVDNWRYYGPDYNCKNSTVQMENNHIHDNMHGVQIVPNENIQMIYNELYGNRYGAISDPWFDGSIYHNVPLQARMNWWGDPTGPYQPSENPSGQGDELYGDVLFNPWITDIAPNLTCKGSLQWENVPAGGTVTGSFTVENTGYLYSELSWKVDEKPSWGEWTITPENGTGLSPGMAQITVQVTVIAPQNKNKEFTGKLKIINTEDPNDYGEIDISLITPTIKSGNFNFPIMKWLHERFPYAFPILRHLMGY